MSIRRLFGKRPRNGASGSEWRVGRSTIKIGRFTYGERNLKIKQWNEGANLTIGAFCSIAQDITILLGGNHRSDWITTWPFGLVAKEVFGNEKPDDVAVAKGNLVIGNDVWIGDGATILSGVTIGDGAIIGAKSVVSKDVPPYGIAVGNPARTVRDRFNPEIVDALLTLAWWDLPMEEIKEIQARLTKAPQLVELKELISLYRGS